MCKWCDDFDGYREDFSRERKHLEWTYQILFFANKSRAFHHDSPIDVRAFHAQGKFKYSEFCEHIENYEHKKNDGTDWCCNRVVDKCNTPQWKHKVSGVLSQLKEIDYDDEYWSLR
jgi:hypothetical protein